MRQSCGDAGKERRNGYAEVYAAPFNAANDKQWEGLNNSYTYPFKARDFHGLHCGWINQHRWSQFKHVSDKFITLFKEKETTLRTTNKRYNTRLQIWTVAILDTAICSLKYVRLWNVFPLERWLPARFETTFQTATCNGSFTSFYTLQHSPKSSSKCCFCR